MSGTPVGARRIVVVGAGLAGLRTVDALRRKGWTEDIVVLGDERHAPYTRPPLSKKLLAEGGADHASVALRMREDPHPTTWRYAEEVVGADLDAATVTLASGDELAYDGLVAASGVRPRRLPLGDPDARLVLRTVDDAAALAAHLGPGVRVVVIGGGFIGCEVAAAARARGAASVDVVTLDTQPMLTPLGAVVGAELRRRHEVAGTTVRCGRTVSEVTRDGDASSGVCRVVLDDGTVLEADVVVEAVGSVPATVWLEGNGLDLADGVVCDAALRLGGRRGTVGVGDVARFPNASVDAVARRVEHWQIAGDTAGRAATTLLGDLGVLPEDPAPFAVVPSFWSDQGVVSVRGIGMPSLGEESEVVEGTLDAEAAVLYRRGDDLVGAVLLGLPRRLGYYTQLVTAASVGTPA
ncbi:FAD-dependent oxidoreductase [Nocardioides zeae]|uniref:FAD-dependent oxidoreductase n=1 Tax=Nocardioides imazamoxiresistens TaxID=3231893 RepID=A0ABU3PSC7_9ACTN|nr:FAD-dependent oxidoreductase [Nocardioides zeae]MDT9592135.1 FAD-dependent oxidoreductase [Nocardioides zeae]